MKSPGKRSILKGSQRGRLSVVYHRWLSIIGLSKAVYIVKPKAVGGMTFSMICYFWCVKPMLFKEIVVCQQVKVSGV